MWQRIQTVFLMIVVIAMIGTIFFPIWTFEHGTENAHDLYAMQYTVKVNGTPGVQYFPYSATAILAIASATLAIISIGKFKNRLLQRKLGALNAVFMTLTVGSAVFFANQLIKTHPLEGQSYSFGLYLPVIAVAANFIANRFIMRDEKLVRDSDRLR